MNEEIKIKVPGNWLQIDFHVHSPCSKDFQGTGRDDTGYIWLLEQAKVADLDIIVITDHNDINGYYKFKEIERDLLSTKRTLERTKTEVPESIIRQISLFEQVTILPGVELDVYPNIHLLVIFDPQKEDEIFTLLNNAGFTDDVRGSETASSSCKWNVVQTLEESDKIGAIVLAAHVDSDKGLYDVTKKWGQNRISAFCDEKLYGMEFINPLARDQIDSIMKSPDYFRKSRLAFVQSSDFHGKPGQRIGGRRTFVRMDNVCKQDKGNIFLALKKALRNPDEYISAPGRPELQAILNNLNDKPSIEALINADDENSLVRYVCSLANCEDGTIVIGRNERGNWVGQFENSELEFTERIRSIIKSNITPIPNFNLQVYPYYGNHYIATIRVKRNLQLCTIKNGEEVFTLEAGSPKQASTAEIINLAESRLIERYSHLSITNRLSEMSQKLLGTEDSIDILSIVRKVDNNSISLREALAHPYLGEIFNIENIDISCFDGNGDINGNAIVLTRDKPRQSDHYLRIFAPIRNLDENSLSCFDKKHLLSGEKIIIAPGGAVYYDVHENIFVASMIYHPWIFTKINENYSGSMKFITAYLKSSIGIWYAERCLGSFDIRKNSVGQNLPIPNKIDSTFQEVVEDTFDKILALEIEFLKAEKLLFDEFPTKEARKSDEFKKPFGNLVDNHNQNADHFIGKIDRLFYEYFKLSDKEIDKVELLMKSVGLASFNQPSSYN